MRRSLVAQLLAMLLIVVAAATVIGIVALWPKREIPQPQGLVPPPTERARVTRAEEVKCGPATRETRCVRVTAEIQTGKDKGLRFNFTSAAFEAKFSVGDRIRVYKNRLPEGATLRGARLEPYSFSDFERGRSMFWLALVFAALVIATGRWQGVRALAGLVASLAIVVFFIVPAILSGQPPATVALVGAFAVMLATIPLAHGLGVKTLAACLGTAGALLLTLMLADFATGFAHLSGVTSEEAAFLRATNHDISLQGLLLAGMVIGALGVLDDLTVSQASTVLALRRANPRLGFRQLFSGALDVGHDHIAATVNTLVLAYAGASLPVLLIFSLADTPALDALNFEAVSEQVVATLVGSIGLIAAVPLTTALAALLATQVPRESLTDAHAGHAH